MSWSFDNTDYPPPYFSAGALDQSVYMWMDVNILEDIGIIKKYYYTNLNELITSSRFITYSFYPNGSRRYQLSVDKVRGEEMPYLRVVGKNGDPEDVVIMPIEHNDRWYYMLDAAELGFTDEPVTLVRYTMDSDDGDFWIYSTRATNLIISDENYTGYTKNFNVNLIVAGKYMGTSDNVTIDQLAERIHARLNLALNPGGIGVRKVNVLYANEHPTVGSDFPQSEEFLHYRDDTKRNPSLNKLSQWPGHEGEITFILGHYIADDAGAGGFSPMPGYVYNSLTPMKCEGQRTCPKYISLVTHQNGGEVQLLSRNITSAAVHELGHFFGLDHTSSWGSSPSYDNISDTPECTNITADISVLTKCPDYGYIMFPYNYQYEHATFTPKQMEVIRSYISSVPHK